MTIRWAINIHHYNTNLVCHSAQTVQLLVLVLRWQHLQQTFPDRNGHCPSVSLSNSEFLSVFVPLDFAFAFA